jgi:pimeloyl-ACP methyl ester carboxylesterase
VKHIASGRIQVALHTLVEGRGTALLALHGLGGQAADWAPTANVWRGPVFGLDFAGHGASGPVRGGAYSPEILVVDADAALHEVGEAVVVGSGIGAWVALLLAGARRDRVPAAGLLPGRGFAGGPAEPDPSVATEDMIHEAETMAAFVDGAPGTPPDPLARSCEGDLRPPHYARSFADAARRVLVPAAGAEGDPPWARAIREATSVQPGPAEPEAMLQALWDAGA